MGVHLVGVFVLPLHYCLKAIKDQAHNRQLRGLW
jgi:hypothetical protein